MKKKENLEEKSGLFKSFKGTAGPMIIAPYAGFTAARKLFEASAGNSPSLLDAISTYSGFVTGMLLAGTEFIGTIALSYNLTEEAWPGFLLIGSSQVINYFYESSKEKDKKSNKKIS